jgi:hypothetical protein
MDTIWRLKLEDRHLYPIGEHFVSYTLSEARIVFGVAIIAGGGDLDSVYLTPMTVRPTRWSRAATSVLGTGNDLAAARSRGGSALEA